LLLCWGALAWNPTWGILTAAFTSTLGYSLAAAASIMLYKREVFPRRGNLYWLEREDAGWFAEQIQGLRGRKQPRKKIDQATSDAPGNPLQTSPIAANVGENP
jgi:hypothetical protein